MKMRTWFVACCVFGSAFVAADDWRLILDLTEHRLDAVADVSVLASEVVARQVAVLMEAAKISEDRADDPDSSFILVRRALLLNPSLDQTVSEFFRLAEKTRA